MRLETIPSIGIIGGTAIATTVTDATMFRSGRDFAAWIGLMPRQNSTRSKQKLGPICKQGDPICASSSSALMRRCNEPCRTQISIGGRGHGKLW